MKHTLRPFWAMLIIFGCVVGISAVSKLLRAKEIVPWRDDFDAAREEGRRDNKPVMAYFTADWCGPCQSMKGTTWADASVEAELRGFVPVRIDIDRSPNLAHAYAVQSIPTMIVLDGEGRVLKSTSGALPPEEFLAWLKG